MPRSLSRIANLFLLLSVALSPVATLAQRLPSGSACPVTINQPYRSPNVSTVYVVTSECQKRPIFNPDVYFSHFDDWQRVIFLEKFEIDAIPDHVLKFLPWGERRVFLNGSLVKTTDDPRVFLLENGSAHPIESENAFKDLGFSFDQIEDVSPDVLTKFTTKQEMIKGADTAPESLVFKYADDARVFELKKEGDALVKEHIQTDAQLRMLVRPDRIAILPRWRTFPDRGQNPSQNPSIDVTAPTVTIAAPPMDATVNGEVVLSATATDNVGVTEVRFFIGSILLKTDAEAPYSASFDSKAFTNGTYNVSVMASDAKGNKTTVFSRLKINNATPDIVAPTVEFTTPAANATVSGSAAITVSAADAEGVANVAFKIGSVTLSTDTTAPYAATLDTTAYANGSYVLTAVATDAAGNQGAATRTITITNVAAPTPDATAPTLSITAPAADATINGSVAITASASDNVGVSSVQFRIGSTVIATDTSSPYAATLETAGYANGALTITAVATDAAGNHTTATRNVTVQNVVTPAPDITAPTVSITAPASNATISGSITITASASDNVGVSSVQFRIGSTTLSTDTSSPYSATLDTTAYTNGSYTLTIVATDAANNTGTATRNITITNTVTPPADVMAPSVSVTSPSSDGSTVSGSITITASASDNVGVSSVQFRIGSTTLSTDTSSPYSATLDTTAYANGSHTLTAVATDAAGNTASANRNITISNQAVPPVQAALNDCYLDATDTNSTINIAVATNRTSGVAPLAVFFDASGSSGNGVARPFHDLSYCWNFGDQNAGTFTYTGKSKNHARGPMTGHVFETPGTYTVTLRVRNAANEQRAHTMSITVENPDTIFSGSNTRCFSTSGNFEGCPSGAQQITTSNLSTVESHVATGRRLLLRRGETFSGGLSINVAGPGIVGAYGTGNRPIINTGGAFFMLSGTNPLLSDWRIMDMDARNGGNVIEMAGKTTNVLALRLRGENVSMGVFAGLGTIQSLIGQGAQNQDISDAMAIVDSEFHANGNGAGTMFVAGRRMMVLGNLMRNVSAEQGQHVIRATYVDRGVFMGNDLADVQTFGNIIKLHGPKFNEAGVGQGKYTEKVVLADNVFRGTGGSQWTVAVAPQNAASDERLRDIMVERNFFLPGSGNVLPLLVSAVDVTVRDNIFDRGSRNLCIEVNVGGPEPAPARVTIVNNTCRSSGTAAALAYVGSAASQVVIRNNLIISPSGNTSRVLDNGSASSGVTQNNNVITSAPGLVSSSPSTWADYRLTAGSPAVNAGDATNRSMWDFELRPRDVSADVGALAYP